MQEYRERCLEYAAWKLAKSLVETNELVRDERLNLSEISVRFHRSGLVYSQAYLRYTEAV